MTPPPGTCTLKDFTQQVGTAFEAAFGQSQQLNRPSAVQWTELLSEFERTLVRCSANSLHHYSSNAPSCPWCRMEQRLGVTLFLPNYTTLASIPSSSIGTGTFDLATLWAQIDAISVPSYEQLTPRLPALALSPSADAMQAKWKRYEPHAIWVGGVLVAVAILVPTPKLWPLALIIAAAAFFYAQQYSDPFSRFPQRFIAIENEWTAALDQWERRCGIERAVQLKASLRSNRDTYQNLHAEEAHRIARYSAQRYELQRRHYLDGFRIRDTKITGVGPAKLATLASYGIETAADVTEEKVLAVPGFGTINSQPLLQWARDCIRGFVYDFKETPADRIELGKIRAGVAQVAKDLRDKLTNDAREFLQAAQAVQRMILQPDPHLTPVHAKRSQIEADLKFLGIPIPSRQKRSSRVGSAPPSHQPYPFARATLPTAKTSVHIGPPSCPSCTSRMIRRTARRGRRSGSQFWGCSRYPACKGTRPI